jgi:hypothetical protein
VRNRRLGEGENMKVYLTYSVRKTWNLEGKQLAEALAFERESRTKYFEECIAPKSYFDETGKQKWIDKHCIEDWIIDCEDANDHTFDEVEVSDNEFEFDDHLSTQDKEAAS